MRPRRRTLSLVMIAGLAATWLAGGMMPMVAPAVTPADAATCTINWTGSGNDGQWQTAANWDLNRVPNSTDYACIASANVTFTTSDTVLGVNQGGGTLTINSGTLTLSSTSEASSINALSTGGGGITVDAGATLGFSSGNTLSLAGSSTLLNDGTVNWTAGTICVDSGALIENAGQFNLGNNLTMEGCSGTGTLQNDASATLERNGGTSATDIITTFTNNGTLEALNGSDVRLRASSTFGATSVLTTDSNASSFVELLAGTDTYSTGAGITGTGVYLDGATLTGSVSASTLNVTGTLNWTGGTFGATGTATIASGGILAITSGNTVSLSASGSHLLNDGTVNWAAGTFCVDSGALLENAGQFNLGNNLAMEGCSGDGSFQNDAGATIEKNGGTSATDILTPLTNNGTVEAANAADIRLRGNQTDGATSVYTTDSNASSFLELFAGTDTYSTGAKITGTGVYLEGTTLTGAASSSVLSVQGTLNWTGGTFGATGTTTIASGAILAITSGNTVSLSASGSHVLNDGTVNWTAGTICVDSGALLENAGQFNLGNNIAMTGCSGNGKFQNDAGAIMERNVGTSATDILTPITNNGTIEALNGSDLRLRTNDFFGATSVLTTDGNPTSYLELFAGTDTYSNGAAITGTGVYLDGATLTGAATTISVGLSLTVYGTLNWTGGTFGAPGVTTIAPSGTLQISSGNTVSMSTNHSHLLNDGTVNWTAGTICVDSGALLENAGQFNVGNNLTMVGCSGNGSFQNDAAGMVLRNGGTNNTDIDTPFTNSGVARAINSTGLRLFGLTNESGGTLSGGTYDAESGSAIVLPGTLTTDAATLIVGSGGSDFFNQGTGQGIESSLNAISAGSSLTLNRSYASSVATFANSGTLTVCATCVFSLGSGTFNQAAGSTLTLGVAGTNSGSFSSIGAGTSTLAGSLNVLNANGFIPSSGQQVQPITTGASGGFADSSSNDWNDAVGSGALTLTANTPAAAPTISSVSPNALGQGATSQKVTINGTNFASGATVTFSNSGMTVTAVTVTSTKITATVNVATTASPGSGSATVTNPDGDTVSSAFTVDAGPQVSSISPTTIHQGHSESIVLTGSNFVNGDSVSLSGSGLSVQSVTVNSATQITISASASGSAKGNSNVAVTAPDFGIGTCYDCLSVIP